MGTLNGLATERAKALAIIRDCERIEKDVTAIDIVLGMHKLQIDLEDVAMAPIRAKRAFLPWGAPVTIAREFVEDLADGREFSFDDLVRRVRERHPLAGTLATNRESTRNSIAYILKVMANENLIAPVSKLGGFRQYVDSVWRKCPSRRRR